MVDERNVLVQDVNTLRGKVLKIDPDTGLGLPDNPFWTGDGDDNASRVWALGLRNPFGMTIDPSDGALIVSDVGWGHYEEINRAAGPGLNFGWPFYEGGPAGVNRVQTRYRALPEARPFYDGETVIGTLTPPTYARDHRDGARAFLLGDVLVGDNYPQRFRGTALFTDWQSGNIEAVFRDPGDPKGATAEGVFQNAGYITSMVMAPDGHLYFGEIGGRVARLEWA